MTSATHATRANARPYTAERYIRLVERIADEPLQRYMRIEEEFAAETADAARRTFVDLGAGYGRVVPALAACGRDVVAVELNGDMLGELERRSARLSNVAVLRGDIQELPALLEGHDLASPVLLLLQNTLGTIEGDGEKVLDAMRRVARDRRGSIVLSLFRARALRDWGVGMYGRLAEMVGEPDLARTQFETGRFVSSTGYESKWWTDREIAAIQDSLGGTVVREVREPEFVIFESWLGDDRGTGAAGRS